MKQSHTYICLIFTLLFISACTNPQPINDTTDHSPVDQTVNASINDTKKINQPSTVIPQAQWIITWQTIGFSRESRPILATSFGSGRRKALIITGIHGDEPEGLSIHDAVMDSLTSDHDLTNKWTFRVVKDMNPDGSEIGSRFNTHGVDLNRNWPTSNFKPAKKHGPKPLSEPETRCVHNLIEVFKPEIILVFHSTKRGPFINFDGPALSISEAWVEAANKHTAPEDKPWKVVPSMGYPTPGSLGTFAGVDRQWPILTVEFLMGLDPDRYRQAGIEGLKAAMLKALNPGAPGSPGGPGAPETPSSPEPGSPGNPEP